MAKNPNIYKFEIIERIITEVDFKTKEEVLDFARKVRDIALEKDTTDEIKTAFKNGVIPVAALVIADPIKIATAHNQNVGHEKSLPITEAKSNTGLPSSSLNATKITVNTIVIMNELAFKKLNTGKVGNKLGNNIKATNAINDTK